MQYRSFTWKTVLAGVMLLSFVSQLSAKEFLVGFAQDTMGNDWRVAQVKAVEAGLIGHENVRFIYTNAKGDNAVQVKHMRDMAKKVDVLIASPRNAAMMTPVISEIYKSGVPVVLLSRTINSDDYTTFIHPDNRQVARKSAMYIAEKLQGKGKVFILQHTPTSTPAIQRTEGFYEVIKNYPGIEIVGMKVANSLRSEAIIQTDKAIKEGLTFDAIYAQSDSMAAGARMALRKNGIDPSSIVLTGIDYITEAQKAILAGGQSASFTYPTSGKEGAQIALKILQGEKVPKEIVIDSVMVTKENAADIPPIF